MSVMAAAGKVFYAQRYLLRIKEHTPGPGLNSFGAMVSWDRKIADATAELSDRVGDLRVALGLSGEALEGQMRDPVAIATHTS